MVKGRGGVVKGRGGSSEEGQRIHTYSSEL